MDFDPGNLEPLDIFQLDAPAYNTDPRYPAVAKADTEMVEPWSLQGFSLAHVEDYSHDGDNVSAFGQKADPENGATSLGMESSPRYRSSESLAGRVLKLLGELVDDN